MASLSNVQKVFAIIAATATVTAAIFTLLSSFVDTKSEVKVAPIRTTLEDHVNSPGHEQTTADLKDIKTSLDYIRGRLDNQWGHDRDARRNAPEPHPAPVPVPAGNQ